MREGENAGAAVHRDKAETEGGGIERHSIESSGSDPGVERGPVWLRRQLEVKILRLESISVRASCISPIEAFSGG